MCLHVLLYHLLQCWLDMLPSVPPPVNSPQTLIMRWLCEQHVHCIYSTVTILYSRYYIILCTFAVIHGKPKPYITILFKTFWVFVLWGNWVEIDFEISGGSECVPIIKVVLTHLVYWVIVYEECSKITTTLKTEPIPSCPLWLSSWKTGQQDKNGGIKSKTAKEAQCVSIVADELQ